MCRISIKDPCEGTTGLSKPPNTQGKPPHLPRSVPKACGQRKIPPSSTGEIQFVFFLLAHKKSVIEGGNYPGAVLKELGHFHALFLFSISSFLALRKKINKKKKKNRKRNLSFYFPLSHFIPTPLQKKKNRSSESTAPQIQDNSNI